MSSMFLFVSELSDTSACRVSPENIDRKRTRDDALEIRVMTRAILRVKFSIILTYRRFHQHKTIIFTDVVLQLAWNFANFLSFIGRKLNESYLQLTC